MEDGCGCFAVLLAVIAVLYIAIYIVLPLSFFLIGGIAAAGAATGAVLAAYNFGKVFLAAHKEIR